MDLKQAALDYHQFPKPGKLSVESSKPCATQEDLSLAYTPGVAEVCNAIAKDKKLSFAYTIRKNSVAVTGSTTKPLRWPGAKVQRPTFYQERARRALSFTMLPAWSRICSCQARAKR